MAVLSDYVSGTITLTNGSNAFTGTGTGWLAASFREGDTILGIEDHAGVEYVIATIDGNGAGTLTQDWEGATGTYTYRMRYLSDGARVTAQAAQLVELLGNGNLQALAGLTGPGVPVFNGPHSMTVKPETDFINGVAYDVQVNTLPDRAAYDGQSAGFSVLVSDIGDGRSAVYSKNTNTAGDWSDPAFVTGPIGATPDVEATVAMLPPGSTAVVTEVPITGGVRLDFELPEASGFYNAGVYNIANPYNMDDVVRFNGSSFIALQAVPAGQAPSGASPPVDTAYWQVLAAKGADGAGTGDVVGPASSVADQFVAFNGTTGKLIKAAPYTPANKAGDQFTGPIGFGVAPIADKGPIQFRSQIGTPGAPATSGTTDLATAASFGLGGAELDIGTYSPGHHWLQSRLSTSFASNTNIVLNPNGGQVLIPQKPSFFATKTDAVVATATVANYNTPNYNVGSAFNPTNGRFTAPVAGLYRFFGQLINQASGGSFRLAFGLNGANAGIAGFSTGINETVPVECQLKLAAGDYVYLLVDVGSSQAIGAGYNFFGGHLIG